MMEEATDYLRFMALFKTLSDEALLSRFASGGLTDTARAAAAGEIRERGLEVPDMASQEELPDENYSGDYEIVARPWDDAEAQILRSCLEASGVPVVTPDMYTSQLFPHIYSSIAGGSRILVPADRVADATKIITAFYNGELELQEE